MPRDGLSRALEVLLIIAVSVYLLEKALQIMTTFASVILLFGLAALLSFALRPVVDRLCQGLLTPGLAAFLSRRGYEQVVVRVQRVRMARAQAVLIVYVALIFGIVALVLVVVPIVGSQLQQFSVFLADFAQRDLPPLLLRWQADLNARGIKVALPTDIGTNELVTQSAAIGKFLVDNALNLFVVVSNLFINLFLLLTLSVYMTIDGPRLIHDAIRLLPSRWREEGLLFFGIVDRVFGGYIRGQVIQSFLYGLATFVVMTALGLPFALVAAVIAALVVIIPFIGGFLAMIPPILIALFISPVDALVTIVALFVLQQVLFNVIMPRLMGQIVGLHPLLIFAALLIGATAAGPWGIVFSIPVAGVLAAVLFYIYRRIGPESAAGDLAQDMLLEDGREVAPAGRERVGL